MIFRVCLPTSQKESSGLSIFKKKKMRSTVSERVHWNTHSKNLTYNLVIVDTYAPWYIATPLSVREN